MTWKSVNNIKNRVAVWRWRRVKEKSVTKNKNTNKSKNVVRRHRQSAVRVWCESTATKEEI